MIQIYQYKETNIAEAPDVLSHCINKYSKDFKSTVTRNFGVASSGNLIHFHNRFKPYNGPQVIQYHSEPFRVHFGFPGKQLVISQYHATLPEYEDCTIVRNIIDWHDNSYNTKDITDKIRIGYSPSTRHRTPWGTKGIKETTNILQAVKAAANGMVDYDIIQGVSLQECIRRKRNCNVIIDECMTDSFHRCALEGLALGKLTICSYSEAVGDIMKKASGSDTLPLTNVYINDLEQYLLNLYKTTTIGDIVLKGKENIGWMEKYWRPEKIVEEFENIYFEVLNNNK